MGWNKPTTKAFDPGEIPGKGQMSDAQSARLDAGAPKNNAADWLGITGGNMDEFEQAALDQIVAMGDQHEEIMAFIDDLLENSPNPENIINVFDDAQEQRLRDEYDNAKLTATFEDTLEIVRTRFIKPAAFYFGMGDPKGTGNINVVITPILCWEKSKTLDKPDFVTRVVPDFLEYVDDSIYEFKDMSPSEVRKEMLKRGFVENHDVSA